MQATKPLNARGRPISIISSETNGRSSGLTVYRVGGGSGHAAAPVRACRRINARSTPTSLILSWSKDGAICPEKGKGAGLVLPRCDARAMNERLIEISRTVDPGAHAVLMRDGAGWHIAGKLVVPDNITLLRLPPRAPELNPVENVWPFLRDNRLGNRVFTSYEDILDRCCEAWNRLIEQPWTIMSIGLRDWAYRL